MTANNNIQGKLSFYNVHESDEASINMNKRTKYLHPLVLECENTYFKKYPIKSKKKRPQDYSQFKQRCTMYVHLWRK